MMLKNNEILKLFDIEVRANPVPTPGLKVVRNADVTRLEGAFNFICSWRFSDDDTEQVVQEQAAHFRQLGQRLIWRVYEYDKPSNIAIHLKQEGFVPLPPGILMVLPLKGEIPAKTDHDIRCVTSPTALRDYLSVAAAAFGSIDAGQFDYFVKLLSDPGFALFCGYTDGEPVASGRLEMVANTSFGLLFGGGVVPAHRGKGFYRALVGVRALTARERGLTYLSTEARETSRPILEKLGFIPLTKEITWILPINNEESKE